jgi:hypothetical protein
MLACGKDFVVLCSRNPYISFELPWEGGVSEGEVFEGHEITFRYYPLGPVKLLLQGNSYSY